MFTIRFFKANSSTYVIKTSNGKVSSQGKGLSFFYNPAVTSISTIPVNAQGAPFIFNLQTRDFQMVKIQGQLNYRVAEPEKISEILNFTINQDGKTYVSEDPVRLGDQVIRNLQSILQARIQKVSLRESLLLGMDMVSLVQEELDLSPSLGNLGLEIIDVAITSIRPSAETARALEAEAREEILKEADDAIYARRKSAVEQERTIKEAELQTVLSVQQKEQEIEELRMTNERDLLRAKAATEQERIQARVDEERSRKELVSIQAENSKKEADMEAYSISSRMNAYAALPVEYMKTAALANMEPEQMMALAFEAFAENAAKIGELNIGPDSFAQIMKKAVG